MGDILSLVFKCRLLSYLFIYFKSLIGYYRVHYIHARDKRLQLRRVKWLHIQSLNNIIARCSENIIVYLRILDTTILMTHNLPIIIMYLYTVCTVILLEISMISKSCLPNVGRRLMSATSNKSAAWTKIEQFRYRFPPKKTRIPLKDLSNLCHLAQAMGQRGGPGSNEEARARGPGPSE